VNKDTRIARLNPADDYVISESDALVLLARDAKEAAKMQLRAPDRPATAAASVDGTANSDTIASSHRPKWLGGQSAADAESQTSVILVLKQGLTEGAVQMVHSLSVASKGNVSITLLGRCDCVLAPNLTTMDKYTKSNH
jgi:hypothetical protein